MFSLYLADIRDYGNGSKIFFGGYDKDFIRGLNGFNDLTDAEIELTINWLPLLENVT